MKRMLPIIIAGALIAGAMLTPVGTYVAGAFRPVEAVTVAQATNAITSHDGKPALIILYGPRCPLSRALLPQFVALSRRAEAGGADVFAYSTGDGLDAWLVGGFLTENNAPFAARRILPWQPGVFSNELRSIGIMAGSTWIRPLVAVRSRDGHIIYQDQAVQDLRPAAAALEGELRGGSRGI
jgi:hypothetical protein